MVVEDAVRLRICDYGELLSIAIRGDLAPVGKRWPFRDGERLFSIELDPISAKRPTLGWIVSVVDGEQIRRRAAFS